MIFFVMNDLSSNIEYLIQNNDIIFKICLLSNRFLSSDDIFTKIDTSVNHDD